MSSRMHSFNTQYAKKFEKKSTMPCTNYWAEEEKKHMASVNKAYSTTKSKSSPKTGLLSEIKE